MVELEVNNSHPPPQKTKKHQKKSTYNAYCLPKNLPLPILINPYPSIQPPLLPHHKRPQPRLNPQHHRKTLEPLCPRRRRRRHPLGPGGGPAVAAAGKIGTCCSAV